MILFLGISSPAYASLGFFKPSSKLHFFQSAIESVRLFFTFSTEGKTDYLLQLTDRRVDEINTNPSPATANRYQTHFKELEKLAEEAKDKEQVVEKIKEASLRQQDVLAKVYSQVPDEAKDAILNAQENSSKNVANAIEAVQGAKKEQEYVGRVEQIQRIEKLERIERLERAPMEGSPNANPADSVPKELKPGQGLNPLNPLNPLDEEKKTGEGGQSGGERIEPAAPAPMQQPVNQQ